MGIKEGRFDGIARRAARSARWCWAAAGAEARASDVTIFKSLGMAVEDVVAADLVLSRAIELGSGAELVL